MHSSYSLSMASSKNLDNTASAFEHDFTCTCVHCKELENAMAFYACPRGCNCEDCKFYLSEMKKRQQQFQLPEAPKKTTQFERNYQPPVKRRRLDFCNDTHVNDITSRLENIDFKTAMEMFLSDLV